MGNKLFNDFAPVSTQEWKDKIHTDLKGADFEKKLVWKTQEGFNMQPYYRQEDLEKLAMSRIENDELPINRGNDADGNHWKIKQDFAATGNATELNKKITSALERGAEAIGIDVSGFAKINAETIATIIQGIDLSEAEIYFSCASDPVALYESLAIAAAEDLALLKGSLGVDPLGKMNATGTYSEEIASYKELVQKLSENSPALKLFTIKASQLQNAGSSLSQELGFGLSMANTYLEQLNNAGLSMEEAAASISFEFTCGPNYFMEIAKLRAARWLWSAICQEWGLDAAKVDMHIQSVTASWNMTIYDPNVNMLRATTEAMSATLGGSDVVSVLPYDSNYKEENDFSSRVARNIQIILKEEAYFNQVADPSAGSYYIEQLTESIAEQAWKHFLEAEEKGSYIEAFKAGFIQEKITTAAEEKRSRAASRRDSILGLNQYPNFNELLLEQGLSLPEQDGSSDGEYPAIKPFKVAKELEELRLSTEKMSRRPKVFLLKYGDPVWMTARAMFTGNFFGCAGYEIIDTEGFETIEEGMNAASEAKADIVVLCSSDALYPEIGPKVQEAMGSKAEVVIAGYPKDSMEALQEAGIKHFIHVRTNLLQELNKFNEILKG